jgi:hypothetical protein
MRSPIAGMARDFRFFIKKSVKLKFQSQEWPLFWLIASYETPICVIFGGLQFSHMISYLKFGNLEFS